MWRRWLASPSVRAHETGRLDTRAFAEQAVSEFGLRVDARRVPRAFHELDARALRRARTSSSRRWPDTHRTAILTNISAVHWPIVESYGLFDEVESVVASYRVGAIKPDRDFFEIALAKLCIQAGDAVFFDDNVVNVEGARACGIESHVVRGLVETRMQAGRARPAARLSR